MGHDYGIKSHSIRLRRNGVSLRVISAKLLIPKSTLSGWFKNIKLSKKQTRKLVANRIQGLKKAQKLASIAHRKAKKARLKTIEQEVDRYINENTLQMVHYEIFLAGLYLGDGFKKTATTGLGSSNPSILKSYIKLLRKIYNADDRKFRGAIYARADQDEEELIDYWSSILKIPERQFHKTQFDNRTRKKKTFEQYKGVCTVYYYDVKIMRRLMIIANKLMEGRIAQLVRAPD